MLMLIITQLQSDVQLRYFNTSHVNVNRLCLGAYSLRLQDFNTSHVNVNQEYKTNVLLFGKFQYISC